MIELDKFGITIQSGVQRNGENPDTFHIPSKKERAGMPEGTTCKMMFEFPDGSVERMWVQVVERLTAKRLHDQGLYYIGKLDNVPFIDTEFSVGDEFFFHEDDVIGIFE